MEELTPPSQTSPGLRGDIDDSRDGMNEEDIAELETRNGSDAPPQPAALPYDLDGPPNGISIFDNIPLSNVFCSPFHHVLAVPNSCINKWGIVELPSTHGLDQSC